MRVRAILAATVGSGLLVGSFLIPTATAAADRGPVSSVPTGLRPCHKGSPVYCGSIEVPLDRTGRTPGTIPIRYEYHPARRANPSSATIVAMEGGPGYATTKSRDYYLDLFTPLMRHRALLLVDQRGTGRSQPINCPQAQRYVGDWVANATKCGERLGARSDLYTTAAAAADLEAILNQLDIASVDLYGDSYGSFSAQTFAVRYPQRVRSLVLDGTYPIEGLDPWYGTTATRLRENLSLFCERSRPTCPVRPQDMVPLTGQVITALRAHPIATRAPNAGGRTVTVTLTPRRVLDTLLNSDVTPGYIREIPAALVAFNEGNVLPLARMVAEVNGASTKATAGKASVARSLSELRAYSEGAYLAYACTDYPTPWKVGAGPVARASQYARAASRLDPYLVSPWTATEWSDSEFFSYDYCIGWPKPRVAEQPFPSGGSYPDTPTLVLNGDFDLRTDLYQAREVAQNFPNSTYVEVPNSGHVTALYDADACASVIVRRFMRTLETGDTSCLHSIPEHRVVAAFAKHAADAPQASVGRRSDQSRASDRRAAYVAVEAVADVIDRWYAIPGYHGSGLYGGRFAMFTTYSDPFVSRVWTFQFNDLRWTKDIAVSGTGSMPRAAGIARMRLTLKGHGTNRGSLTLTWPTRQPGSVVTIKGEIGQRSVNLRAPAPSYS